MALLSLFVPPGSDVLRVRGRMEGPGDRHGMFMQDVRPGQSLWGWTYDELRALGNGMYELNASPATSHPSSHRRHPGPH
jgi:hypothetical protein